MVQFSCSINHSLGLSLFLGWDDRETLRRHLTSPSWEGRIFLEMFTGTEDVCPSGARC